MTFYLNFIFYSLDTPEVAQAKVEHARAFELAAAAAAVQPERRKKRGLTYTYPALAAPALGYNTLGYSSIVGAPAVAYTSPLAYHTGAVAVASHPVAYAAAPAVYTTGPVLRQATLTKVVNTPGHAVSYRVD